MPIYEYVCEQNGQCVEVFHPMSDKLTTWGDLCRVAGLDPGETPTDAPVEKLLFVPGISTPTGNSKLKELGFTKLVKRDSGVYENVTATGGESRYMNAGDASTMPNFKAKISD